MNQKAVLLGQVLDGDNPRLHGHRVDARALDPQLHDTIRAGKRLLDFLVRGSIGDFVRDIRPQFGMDQWRVLSNCLLDRRNIFEWLPIDLDQVDGFFSRIRKSPREYSNSSRLCSAMVFSSSSI